MYGDDKKLVGNVTTLFEAGGPTFPAQDGIGCRLVAALESEHQLGDCPAIASLPDDASPAVTASLNPGRRALA